MAGLRQICDKTRFTKKNYTRKLRETYDKMYNSSLVVSQQHQTRVQ